MREHGMQAPHRVGRRRGPVAHDGTIITQVPDQMWGTDMSTTVTVQDDQVAVMVAVDHCSLECVGIHAAKSGNRYEALEPIRQAVSERLGGFSKDAATGLSVRHDHGSAYLSEAFQGELKFLGIDSSPAFIREPQGNGCAERFIRILKENLLWVHTFANVEELRQALIEFKRQYNETWILQRHGYLTPRQAAEAAIRRLAEAA
jgi:transposase InsO family protein